MSSLLQKLGLIAVLICASSCAPDGSRWSQLWWSKDQQAQRLLDEGAPAEAAELFRDLEHRAHALFAAGDFEEAAAAFGALGGARAEYNRGTALVMLGKYPEAIEGFERALAQRPDWVQARENLEVARARQAKLDAAAEERTSQGTEVGADEVVFDGGPPNTDRDAAETEVQAAAGLDDRALQELWLRRVENRPGDFLRVKFAAQARLADSVEGAPR